MMVDDVWIQILRGRYPNTGIQKQQRFGSEVSIQPAHEDILKPMERGRLGHKGWTGEDGLVQGPVCGIVQELPCGRV